MIIDITKLENVKNQGDKITAACPQCRNLGRDAAGNHLGILKDGRFNCIAFSNDSDHNKEILKLVGVGPENGDYEIVKEVEEKVELPKRWPLSTLDRLIRDHSYWEGRGIPSEVAAKFGGGIATSAQMQGRYVIPIFNLEKTEIIGFTGRALNGQNPKYKHLGKRGSFVWSPDINSIKEKGYILLIEGPADGFKLASWNSNNFMALFGTTISDYQISYLIGANPAKIFIGTNNEPGNSSIGNLAAERIRDKLLKFFDEDRIKITLPLRSKDFADMKDDEFLEWKMTYEK